MEQLLKQMHYYKLIQYILEVSALKYDVRALREDLTLL